MSRPEPICHHHLFVELVGPEDVVLDLGAYEGSFTRGIAERTAARVVAVEANPRMCELIEPGPRVEVLNLAVGERVGSVELFLGSNLEGTSLFAEHPFAGGESVVVPMTTLPRLVAEHCAGRVGLLKCNIEGAEIPMLRACDDRTLTGIRQITMQFHDFLPELDQAADVAAAKQRLAGLGFAEILFKSPNKDVLFVNLRAGVMGRGRFLAEKALVRCRQYARALEVRLRGKR